MLWLPWGPSNVWDQAYAYHLDVAGDRTPGANLAKVVSTLGDRDLPVVVALALAVGERSCSAAGAVRPDRETRWTSPDTLLLTWLGGHRAWCCSPSTRSGDPTCPSSSRAWPCWPPATVRRCGSSPSVPCWWRRTTSSTPGRSCTRTATRRSTAEVLDELRALPPGALAISDDPGIVWRAGRRTHGRPRRRVDPAHRDGSDHRGLPGRAAGQPDVCAVVVRSRVRWGSFADLPGRLAAAGYLIALDRGIADRVYLARDCDPP